MDMDTENEPLHDESNSELKNTDKWNKSTSICSTGLSVTWKNLTVLTKQNQPGFYRKTRFTYKNIIRNVSGGVKSGTLVAILGASGSGKSTLMSVLANRQQEGLQVHGQITIGGVRTGKFTRYVTGFVYQDDLFSAALTASEHLNFVAKLRLDRNISEISRKVLIKEILNELGLTKVANRKIGVSKLGAQNLTLSGGERKRLSIASELIIDPSLLFCDEPTTGLDSFTALTVVTNLKALANKRYKTIICSIHQPSEQIFELFDQIILLSGGRIAFSGSSSEAISFFKANGYAPSEDQNPADFLVQSLAIEAGVKSADKFCSLYENSEYYTKTLQFVDDETKKHVSPDELLSTYSNRLNEPLWFDKLLYLTHRCWLCLSRDKGAYRFQLIQKLLLGVLIGFCLHDTITWTQRGLQALKGAVFFLVTQNFFPPMNSATRCMPNNLPIFFREYLNNTTTPSLFQLSTVISLLPRFIIDPVLFTMVIYFVTNIPGNIFTFLLTCIVTMLVYNVSATLGMLISVVVKNRQMDPVITAPIVTICVMCSGVYIKLSSIPAALQWIRSVSWFTNGVETLFIVHLQGVQNIECYSNPTLPCLKNGAQVLDSYDFHATNLWSDILKMFVTYLILHFCLFLVLLKRTRQKKIKK